jgi:hypothetical protein
MPRRDSGSPKHGDNKQPLILRTISIKFQYRNFRKLGPGAVGAKVGPGFVAKLGRYLLIGYNDKI